MTFSVPPFRLTKSLWAAMACGVLSACGGGSDNTTAATTPPADASSESTFKKCTAPAAEGTVHTYTNAARPHVAWRKATYAGERLDAEVEYVDAAQPLRIRYTRPGTDAQTVVAQEVFNPATGELVLREQYEGRKLSTKLKEGESETVGYIVKTLIPAQVTDRTEILVRTYVGDQEATFNEGRLKTCVVTEAVSESVNDSSTSLSTATLHYTPGLNVVKRYEKATDPKAAGRDLTVLSELIDSTATRTYLPDAAATQPTLASCNQLPPALDIILTASNDSESNSARRQTVPRAFNNQAALALLRSRLNGELTQIRYLDAIRGYTAEVGRENFAAGQMTSRSTITGIPDLRNVALGQTVDYTRATLTPPAAAPTLAPERFSFVGHKKVTTPAGSFDTCQVRFDYSGGSVETVYLVPNSHWARLESRSSTGVLTVRELIQR